ncbi:ABC transporter ATP-binding protein [Oxalobacteraceae bacterium A2-2]
MKRQLRIVFGAARGQALGLTALSLVNGALPAAIAVLGGYVLDAIALAARGDRHAADSVPAWVAAEAALVIAAALLGKLASVVQATAATRVRNSLVLRLMDKYLTLSYEQVDTPQMRSDYMLAQTDGVGRGVAMFFSGLALLQNVVMLGTAIAVITRSSAMNGLILAAAAIPGFLLSDRHNKRMFNMVDELHRSSAQQHYLQDALVLGNNAKEVKLYNLPRLLLPQYTVAADALAARELHIAWSGFLNGGVVDSLGTLSVYIVYAITAVQAAQGSISIGQLAALLLITRQTQGTLSTLLSGVSQMRAHLMHFSNYLKIIDLSSASVWGSAREGAVPGDGLRFIDVHYTYPGKQSPALRGVNLHLPEGKSLAVVGMNGAGKSTFIKLAAGLLQPSAGSITLDGTDLRQWNEDALRARTSALFQDFSKYHFTAGLNIGLGDVDDAGNRERWQRAAWRAFADRVLEQLPRQYDTMLGRTFDGGVELSGGEWQKIAMARAYMREEPGLLVLDEPSAALDVPSEDRIFREFRQGRRRGMVILVSHRLAGARHADRIAVFHQQAISEYGNHEQLLALDGAYARMYRMQASGFA